MRYLIVIPVPGAFENMACLEQAIDLSKRNHEVFLLDLSRHGLNRKSEKFRDLMVSATHGNRFHQVTKRIAKEYGLTIVKLAQQFVLLRKDSSSEELESIFSKGFASKFSHITGTSKTKLSDFSNTRVRSERRSFLLTYTGVRRIISAHEIEEVITWNGRFLLDSASVLAARHENIPVRLLEVGSAADLNMQLYEISPHSISNRVKLQLESWANAGFDAAEKAEFGLEMRMFSSHPEGGSWKDDFDKNFDTSHFDSKKLAVFFTTTDIEYSTFSDIDEATSFNGSQVRAFLLFCHSAQHHGYDVVVRVHPPGKFSKAISRHEDEIWNALCMKTGALMLGTHSGIDSVDLMMKSDLNVTYSSSIGVESILLERPTLILGQTDYSHLVEESCAFSESEIEFKLASGIVIPKRSNLYPWGYWYAFGGKKLQNFSKESSGEIYYNDLHIEKIRSWYRVLKLLLFKINSNFQG